MKDIYSKNKGYSLDSMIFKITPFFFKIDKNVRVEDLGVKDFELLQS